jgi:flagellar M-ring protein FliF
MAANIDYIVEEGTGAILVQPGSVHSARMKLAAAGLPNGSGDGYELLDRETGFGQSQFLENVRHRRALEGEIARSISALTNVKSARVHLAIPKQSVFVRERRKPSASIVIDLYPGRTLEPGQVDSIVHLASASVPELQPGEVTVVDNRGRMLSSRYGDGNLGMATRHFEYAQTVETSFVKRIEDILGPILGAEHVRAQVTAEIDGSALEQTQETYNPDQPALRSEQVSTDLSNLPLGAQGIPGALSNQPPAAGIAPEDAIGAEQSEASQGPGNSSERATRNYELDKTISHMTKSAGAIRRLSVAVVVDHRYVADAEGVMQAQPRSVEEMEQISSLVREAIGFDARRGDRVNVINSQFQLPEAVEALPVQPMWEQPWFWDVVKQGLGALFVLFVLFGVLKPTLRSLVSREAETQAEAEAGQVAALGAQANDDVLSLSRDGVAQLGSPEGYEQRLEIARQAVQNDPKRVAQVMKNWVDANE